jgi:hypothetical protein
MIPIFFQYPEWINEIGYQLGLHRANNNRSLDAAAPQFKRPDKYHIIGATGELIFLLFCQMNKMQHESNILFGDKPIVGYDLILFVNNQKYFVDVKTQGIETKKLSVGVPEHNKKDKFISTYVFVKLLGNNTCNIYRCKKSDVNLWQIAEKKWEFTTKQFYYKQI